MWKITALHNNKYLREIKMRSHSNLFFKNMYLQEIVNINGLSISKKSNMIIITQFEPSQENLARVKGVNCSRHTVQPVLTGPAVAHSTACSEK